MASIVEYLNHGDAQGRNFGLKMGVPIQKENEVPLGPDAKEENGEEISPPHPTLGSGRVL